MPGCRTVFRVAALCLLLLTGVELFACELLYPNGCESYGSPASQQTQSDDNCFCCCFHIMVARLIQLDHQETPIFAWVEPDTGRPQTQPSRIYHPPRA